MIYDGNSLISHFRTPEVEPFKPYDINSFACKCGCGKLPDNDYFVNFMNYLFERSGKMFEISSCIRCKEHNKKVGGIPTSDHLYSLAIDILTPTIEDRSELVFYAFNYRIKRAIIYINRKFVHLSINYDKKLTVPFLAWNEEIVKGLK
jgi:hypothetical protein